MLTDAQLSLIAHEARTRPPAEAARHLFPLISHVSELADRVCQTCLYWVAYNRPDHIAARGECRYHAADGSAVRLQTVDEGVAYLTPFDWSCRGWAARPLADNTAQRPL